MKRKLEKKRERKGKKRSKGIQASNHRRLQGLLISMILFLSLFIPSHIFQLPRRRPLIISFLLFTVWWERSTFLRPENLFQYLQWRVANWSKSRCFGDVGRAMLQLWNCFLIVLWAREEEGKRKKRQKKLWMLLRSYKLEIRGIFSFAASLS